MQTFEFPAEPHEQRIVVKDDKGRLAVFWLELKKGRGNTMILEVVGRRTKGESKGQAVSDLLPKG